MASDKSSEITINGPTQVKGPSQVRSIPKGNTPSATASDKSNEIAIEVRDHLRSKSNSIGKASSAAPLITSSEPKGVEKAGWKKGIAITDFLLRFCAIGASLAAATAMGTTDETLPFFTQFFQFQAQYDDFPEFMFFVIVNAMVGGYLVLSLPFSIFRILRPLAAAPRLLLIVSDVVMMALTIAAAASAASIVYLAHNGNSSANWMAICNQFGDFCKSVSGAVVGSFIAAIILIFLVLLSAFALKGC